MTSHTWTDRSSLLNMIRLDWSSSIALTLTVGPTWGLTEEELEIIKVAGISLNKAINRLKNTKLDYDSILVQIKIKIKNIQKWIQATFQTYKQSMQWTLHLGRKMPVVKYWDYYRWTSVWKERMRANSARWSFNRQPRFNEHSDLIFWRSRLRKRELSKQHSDLRPQKWVSIRLRVSKCSVSSPTLSQRALGARRFGATSQKDPSLVRNCRSVLASDSNSSSMKAGNTLSQQPTSGPRMEVAMWITSTNSMNARRLQTVRSFHAIRVTVLV